MTVQTAPARRPSGGPVKSPLAAHSHGTTAVARTRIGTPGTSKSPRGASIADFSDYLRTTNNRNGRPYEEATVENYVFAARALDRWMTAEGIDGDFTVADTAMLNRFLRDYFRQHGQGGTHSQQRNMRHLFSYLARETGHPHPYPDALHRYSEQKQRRPATLSADFIKDLIEVTGNGRARDFEGARDHAMIRILTEGIRRGELLGMTMSALPDDLIRNPVIRVVPLKGARASGQGRLWCCSRRPAPGRSPSICGYAAATGSPILTGCGWGPATAASSARQASARCSSAAPLKQATGR